MIVENMISPNGNPVANQFIIHHDCKTYFQSYRSLIAVLGDWGHGDVCLIDGLWDMYSATTNKYLNQFLGTEGIDEIRERVASGEYRVVTRAGALI